MGLGPEPGWWLQLRPAVVGVGPAVTRNTVRPCPHSPCPWRYHYPESERRQVQVAEVTTGPSHRDHRVV